MGDLGRAWVALVDLVLMAIFLRALVAPIYLLASSVLALAAALGITTYVFQVVLGGEDLTYYVPFAHPCCSSRWAATARLSRGADMAQRRTRPLRSAIETAAPSARHAI